MLGLATEKPPTRRKRDTTLLERRCRRKRRAPRRQGRRHDTGERGGRASARQRDAVSNPGRKGGQISVRRVDRARAGTGGGVGGANLSAVRLYGRNPAGDDHSCRSCHIDPLLVFARTRRMAFRFRSSLRAGRQASSLHNNASVGCMSPRCLPKTSDAIAIRGRFGRRGREASSSGKQ